MRKNLFGKCSGRRSLCSDNETVEGEYDLALGSYTVDAKSILGVFALGIGKALDLVFVNSKGEDQDVLNAVERYRRAA